MSPTGWQGFARQYRAVWSLGAVFGLAGPLAMWRASLDPPWPSEARWVAVLMCGVTAVMAYLAAQSSGTRGATGKHAQETRRKRARIAAGALLLGMLTSLAYLYQLGLSVVEETQPSAEGDRHIRVVAGSERMPELRDDRRSDLDVLRDHLYRPEEVWTATSLLRSRMSLLALYVLAFCLLTLGLCFAVLSMTGDPQERRRGPAKQPVRLSP